MTALAAFLAALAFFLLAVGVPLEGVLGGAAAVVLTLAGWGSGRVFRRRR